MTSALLRKTLSELRERFAKLAEEKERLRVVLVEVPIVTRTPPFPKGEPPGIQGEMVGFWNQCYRHPAVREDDSSKPKGATTPFFDVSGNKQQNEEGQFVDYADVGAVRSVRIEGDAATWERFQLLAADAGHLLESCPAPVQSHFPHETLEVAAPVLRWIYALFDLAWKRTLGSPLRPEIEKSVRCLIDPNKIDTDVLPGDISIDVFSEVGEEPQPDEIALQVDGGEDASKGESEDKPDIGNEQDVPFESTLLEQQVPSAFQCLPVPEDVALAEWTDFLENHPQKEAVLGFSDPPEWFSTLADLAQASVYAIDILLAEEPDDQESLESLKKRAQDLNQTARLAYLSFVYASQEMGQAASKDLEAYEWLKERAPLRVRKLKELSGYEPPSFDTWARYLRNARHALGEQKHNSRSGREHGRHVATSDDVG